MTFPQRKDQTVNEIPVTLVTANATQDDEPRNRGYTDEAAMYREIYAELRQNLSLDKFVDMLGSQYSKAYWSKYERGVTEVTRQAKNELRRAVGMPELVPTVTEAMADVGADAEVWRIGDNETVHRVVKIATYEKVTLELNGIVEVRNQAESPVTTVTSSVEANAESAKVLEKSPRTGVSVSRATVEQNERRQQLGASWRDVIEAGLRALEAQS